MQALEMQLLNTAFALLDQLYTEADARETREIVEICAGFCPKCTHTQVDSHMTDYLKISRRQLIRVSRLHKNYLLPGMECTSSAPWGFEMVFTNPQEAARGGGGGVRR